MCAQKLLCVAFHEIYQSLSHIVFFRHLRTSSELKEQQQIVEELVTSKKVLQSQIVDIEGENIKRRCQINSFALSNNVICYLFKGKDFVSDSLPFWS